MMPFAEPTIFVIHCAVYCVLVIVAIIPVGLVNPRMMLQNYPKDIQAVVAPKTPKERSQGIIFAIPIILVMIGYPAVVSWYYRPNEAHFDYYFSSTWSMMLVFNVFDLLILDWLMFCYFTPRFLVIRGTEGHEGYKNYRFHFMGFLKGIFITAIICAIMSGLLVLI
jgi:hypothetical protein